MTYPTILSAIERDIRAERARQDAQWGQQNHPDGTGGDLAEQTRDIARARCQEAASRGAVNWALIFAEEVFEAIAETDEAKLRRELVQTAAVIVAWLEDIDRRQTAAQNPAAHREPPTPPSALELATVVREALTLPSPTPTHEAMNAWSQLMTRRASRVRSALTHVAKPGLLDAAWALRELRKIPTKAPVNYTTEDGKKPPTPYDGLIGKWVSVLKEGARHPERFKLLRVEDGALWVTAPMHGEDYVLIDDVASVELAEQQGADEQAGGAR